MASASKPRWTVVEKEEAPESFNIIKRYRECISSVLIPNDQIIARFDEIAVDIVNFYKDRPFVILVILKGAVVAFGDLIKSITKAYEKSEYENNLFFEFVQLKSYENTGSTGKVEIIVDQALDVKGKEILVVEDIVETGHTMRKLISHLKELQPKDVQVFSVMLKVGKTEFDFPIEFVAFLIPDKFVIGYGMDFNQYFRDIPHLCIISKAGIAKFKI